MGAIRNYISQQPEVVRSTFYDVERQLAALDLPFKSGRQTYLVGSGTSRNALLGVQRLLQGCLGAEVVVDGPLSFMSRTRDDTLAGVAGLFLSQSGSSATTIEAQAHALKRGMDAVAVTAERDSRFANEARTVVELPIGDEPVGPKTKGYTASVAALLSLANRVGQRATGPAPSVDANFFTRYQTAFGKWMSVGDALAERFHRCRHMMFLAQGRHLATASEASLKVQEMSGVGASVFDLEEGLHGRFHGLDKDSLAIFVVHDEGLVSLALNASEVLEEVGVNSLIVSCGLTGANGRSDSELVETGNTMHLTVSIPTTGLAELDLLAAIVPFQSFAEHTAQRLHIIPEQMRYEGLSRKLGIKLGAP